MKKSILSILILMFGLLQISNAQLLKDFGLKAAVTSANQEFEFKSVSSFDTQRRVGVNLALFAEWLDVPYISLVTQVEYAQRGFGVDMVYTGPYGPEPLSTKTFYSRVDYLSIPVLAKLRLQTGAVAPYFLAGPRGAFLLGYKSDGSLFDEIYDKFKKATLGGTAGFGVQVESVLPVTLLAEARYNFDFGNAYDTHLMSVRNSAFDFWLGVAF